MSAVRTRVAEHPQPPRSWAAPHAAGAGGRAEPGWGAVHPPRVEAHHPAAAWSTV